MEKKVAVKKLSSTSIMIPFWRVVRLECLCDLQWFIGCLRLINDVVGLRRACGV
jgi:hypothetical protein